MTVRSDVSIRNFSIEDIPMVLNYWFHSPSGFIESMGVDWNKMPKESDMRTNLTKQENHQRVVTILFQGQPIGIHTVMPVVPEDHAIFHAHIMNPDFRKKGIAQFSYPLACKEFFERFQLKRIIFKTPLQNVGAIRVREKLGIRVIGEEIINFSIIKEGTKAKVFELLPNELDNLLNR